MPKASVLISGLGIAGPTLAYWLLAHGFTPTLVERAPRPRTGGYVIDFWGHGYDVAEKMGLLPELARSGYHMKELRFVDHRGRRVGGFGVDVFRRLTGGRYLSLRRADLAQAIVRTIEGRCEIIFDDHIIDITPQSDRATVTFAHAPRRDYDLVVGGDGLHSSVRSVIFGPPGQFERYLGYMAAAFEVTGYRPRDEGVYVSYGLPGKQVSRLALREDRTLFLLVFAAAHPPRIDGHDIEAQRTLLRREYQGAGWECPEILAALDRCDTIYFDRVSQVRMDAWSRERVALVGDAAFCPSLLAGEGTSLAMTAAYVLAGELAKAEGRCAPAFTRYHAMLSDFILGKQRAAERFAGSFAPRTRLGLVLRNQISKALRLPLIADYVIGRDLRDRLPLPQYPAS